MIAATSWRRGEPGFFAGDWDACFLDDRPIDDWPAILAAGRLADVEGAFALAWVDREGVLHLARDAIGARTLVYAPVGDAVHFGSSIRDLLARVPARLNLASIATYLTYAYLPGRETLAEGVYELLPGEEVVFDGTRRERRRFWPLPVEPIATADEGMLRERLRALLESAVERLLLAPDQPLAATLSGGIDSSLVVALAARRHRAPITAYSVSFGDRYPNELEFSRLVAAHCGVRHEVVTLTPQIVLAELDRTVAALNDPIGDPLTVPNTMLFREAARVSPIVLNGEGGDPCFGGPKNLPMVLSELYGGARTESYLRAHLKCYDDLPEMLAPRVLEALAHAPLEAPLAPLLADPARPDLVARLQAINIAFKGAHHILPKVAALARLEGALPRAPLFDRRIVRFSLTLPSRMKLNGAIEKYLLKEAVRDLLPPVIVERPKSGMLVPVEGWFRGPLIGAARERILEGLGTRELFARDYLERLLAGKLGGLRPRHGAKIWLLVTLEAWLRASRL